jgi:hypothetical protein
MEITQAQLSTLVQEVLDGNADSLMAFAILKEHKKFVDKCIEEIEDSVFAEADLYTEKTIEKNGFTFTTFMIL